jgi:hypothetical protein
MHHKNPLFEMLAENIMKRHPNSTTTIIIEVFLEPVDLNPLKEKQQK